MIPLALSIVFGAGVYLVYEGLTVPRIGNAGASITYLVHRHDRRRAEVQSAMVEAIGQLRDAIRTGLSVPDAFVGLARGGPVAMRPELTTLVREMRLMGFEPAIGAMRDRL